MNNTETLATLSTRHTTKTHKKKRNQNDEQHGPNKKPGVNLGTCEG